MANMQKKLLVVESPTKARTIDRYLGGQGYEVVATVGHLRDLPKSKMGVDLDKDFEVQYVVDAEKNKIVSQLKKMAKGADEVYLATDPDREGEAISWHVAWLLGEDGGQKKTSGYKRISFHEITKEAIEEALEHPRAIDMDLVNAQQARRVLDRVVGYSLSPVLWRKVRKGLSAGRVQSVAVRLICEREKEIASFKAEKYFKVTAVLIKEGQEFLADLVKVDGKRFTVEEKLKLFDGVYGYSKSLFEKNEQVEEFIKRLGREFTVEKVSGKEISRTPLPAYTTSKLQQAAARRMGWSGKQTMSVAQRLYEKGLITYHRTDSVYLADKAIKDFREFIGKKYGSEYVAAKVRVYRNKAKNAQEAHEAIRPTSAERMVLDDGDSREKRLYEMIWKRAVATQAAVARMESTTAVFINDGGLFQSKGVRMLFDGFLKITREKHEDQLLPKLKEGEAVGSKKVNYEEVSTNPPPRYSEASLVSSLEKQGIGRPSTYAPIISTIQQRQYVEKEDGRFRPTSLGVATNEFLVKNFESILSLPFTAEMEGDLDKVSLGKLEWREMMKRFWRGFEVQVKEVEKNAARVKVEAESLGEKCPQCQEGDLVVRVGRFGKFVACSRFPECKYSRQLKEVAGFKCPECGAEGVVKRTKTGRRFFGCSNYPKCKWAGWKKPA